MVGGKILSAAVWLLLLPAFGCSSFRNERFENPVGTDEIYSDGASVTLGNSVDPDASPADVGSPSGWGTESGKVSIGPGPIDGGALWRHRFWPGSTRGFFTRLETVIAVDHLEEGQSISIAVVKPEGGPEDPVAAWALYFIRYNGETFFLWSVGNFDKLYRYPPTGHLEIGRRYVHTMAYDLVHDVYGWAVDSQPVAFAPIPPTYFQDIGTIVLGSSESSTGRDSSYYVDNYVFGEVNPSQSAPTPESLLWSSLALGLHRQQER